jgi:hypothetical protein
MTAQFVHVSRGLKKSVRAMGLHPAEFGSFVAIVYRSESAGRWRLALGGCGQ